MFNVFKFDILLTIVFRRHTVRNSHLYKATGVTFGHTGNTVLHSELSEIVSLPIFPLYPDAKITVEVNTRFLPTSPGRTQRLRNKHPLFTPHYCPLIRWMWAPMAFWVFFFFLQNLHVC